jgi:hypothetical protein
VLAGIGPFNMLFFKESAFSDKDFTFCNIFQL